MADATSKHVEKLTELLGFDPVKRSTLTQDLFKEVVSDISKDRIDKAKAQAKDLLTKALQLRDQKDKCEKDFAKEMKKFDKELGKVMNQIQGLLSGKEPQEEGGEGEKEESKEEGTE